MSSGTPTETSVFETRTIQEVYAEIQDVYERFPQPWVIGYSGGKDSTAVLQMVWKALEADSWRAGGWENMVTDPALMAWSVTPTGQAQFLRDLIGAVAGTPGGHGAGVVWWYPESIQVPGLFVWGGGSLSLFNAGGYVLPGASEFGAN